MHVCYHVDFVNFQYLKAHIIIGSQFLSLFDQITAIVLMVTALVIVVIYFGNGMICQG